jgi:hypothetical protein
MSIRGKTLLLAVGAGIFMVGQQQISIAQHQPNARQQATIANNEMRHFGDAPDNPGPLATDLSTSTRPAAVAKAMRKVADWQLARSQPYFDRV